MSAADNSDPGSIAAIEGALKVTSTSATLKAEAITIAATGSATISGGKVLTISADLVKIN